MYKLFSSIPLLSTSEREARKQDYYFSRYYNQYRTQPIKKKKTKLKKIKKPKPKANQTPITIQKETHSHKILNIPRYHCIKNKYVISRNFSRTWVL